MQRNFITRLALNDGSTLDANLIKEAQRKRPGFSPSDIKSISYLPINSKISRGAIIIKRPSQRIIWGFVGLIPLKFASADGRPLEHKSGGLFCIITDDDGTEEIRRYESAEFDMEPKIGAKARQFLDFYGSTPLKQNRNSIFMSHVSGGRGAFITVNEDTGGVTTQGRKTSIQSEGLISFGGRSISVQIVEVI